MFDVTLVSLVLGALGLIGLFALGLPRRLRTPRRRPFNSLSSRLRRHDYLTAPPQNPSDPQRENLHEFH